MLTPETNYLVAIERHKDHIRKFERINWWQLEKPEAHYQTWNRKACCWLDRLLRSWGTRLEQYGTPAAPPKMQQLS